MLKYSLLFLSIFILSSSLFSQTVFTYRAPESIKDTRYDYDRALLKLALDKTLESDGQYILKASPQMNNQRMFEYLEKGQLQNPMFKINANKHMCSTFSYINFPVDLGIVGYRVFFVSPEKQAEFNDVKNLEDLKKFSIIQGAGWSDVSILRDAGFKVDTLAKYESLFVEVAKSKSDLFPRGINEIVSEWNLHYKLEGLAYNKDIILYYPLPRFFFTSKGNERGLDRVERGLKIAYDDGSLVALWEKHYRRNIDQFGEKNKIIITIDNPLISDIDRSYEKYLYKF